MSSPTRYQHRGRLIRAEIQTPALPEQVWEAWAAPEKLSQWFADRAAGEARPGSIITWFFDDFGYQIPYEAWEAVPGGCLTVLGSLPGCEARWRTL